MAVTATRTRSRTTTCSKARVEAVLDLFLGDLAAFIANSLTTRERATDWLRDLMDVLLLEAVERFQVKLALPSGRTLALDYEVSDDGRIGGSDECGGFPSHWIAEGTQLSLVIRWRTDAPNYKKARQLLRGRGWGPGSMLEATADSDRTFSKDGYGLRRRRIGEWKQ